MNDLTQAITTATGIQTQSHDSMPGIWLWSQPCDPPGDVSIADMSPYQLPVWQTVFSKDGHCCISHNSDSPLREEGLWRELVTAAEVTSYDFQG